MRSFGVRLPILAATAWAGIGLSVSARDLGYSETVYVTPTVATLAWPTSYVSSRSYVVPTAYSFPSYLPAAYVDEPVTLAPTTYVTTAYRLRRGLFGRLRLVERPVLASYAPTYLPSRYILPTYYATSYRAATYTPTVYTPTVFEYPRVWESSYRLASASDCDPVPCDTPVTTSTYRSYPAASQGDSAAAQTYSVPPRSSVGSGSGRSGATDDPTIPSNVGPAPAEEPAMLDQVPGSRNTATPEVRADSPPKPPVPAREQSTAAPIQPAPAVPATGTEAPAKPGANAPAAAKPAPSGGPAEPEIKPAPLDNAAANRRETLRPIYSTPRTLRPELRNVLIGRVESEAGEPLGEVSVSVARTDNNLIRRTGLTNAFGSFAIRLTDGEWDVSVKMPSGRSYPVRSVTVSNGRVVDNKEGREVRNLIISY